MSEEKENASPREQRPYRTGGYAGPRQQQGGYRKDKPQARANDFLPHPELLESYDYVVEGSAKTLLSMFEHEQKHRHEWEKASIRIYQVSTILGQLLGFLIAVSVFVSASVIGIYGDSTIAAMIWVFGMAIVVMAGLVWAYAKSMGQRPLFARPAMRSHYRPQKQRSQRNERQEPENSDSEEE